MKKNIYFSLPLIFEEGTSVIQIFKTGSWYHNLYGDISINPDDNELFVKNFNENVRGQDLPIDVDHKRGEAAGWIKKLMNRGKEGLFAVIEWTKLGEQLIKDKIYKYVSADFDFEYNHPENGNKYKNVLNGASLVNYPFLKGMAEVALSEESIKNGMFHVYEKKEEGQVKELLKAMGLKENATEQDMVAKFNETRKEVKLEEGKEIVDSKELSELKTKSEEQEKQLKEKVSDEK